MHSITKGSAGCFVLLPLMKELPVHREEQLLTVCPEAGVATYGFDDIKTCSVIAASDREVAEQAGQGAWFQLQCSLETRDLGRNWQRAAVLPLRYGGLAYASGTPERSERQPALCSGLLEDPAELFPAHSSRHGSGSFAQEADILSIAYSSRAQRYPVRHRIQIYTNRLQCFTLVLLPALSSRGLGNG